MNRRSLLAAAGAASAGTAVGQRTFPIRPDYLQQPESIPAFWLSTPDEVRGFLEQRIRKGAVSEIGRSAGGRPIRAVFYGKPRGAKGTTTFSGSLGYRDVRAWMGPDYGRKVYWAMAAVHGGEFEGIVGAVNLLSVLETGADLRGKQWPDITTAAAGLDRIIVIPIVNADGRARVPIRMGVHRGSSETVAEYLNTGGRPDGSLIGWPDCKEFIPLDFSRTQFPGGYPNDAGVNFQHDDFFGSQQPETRALLALAARERPDLTMSMHTGAVFIQPLRSFIEPVLQPVFDSLYRRILTKVTEAGLRATDDAAKETDPARVSAGTFNLESAINMHCGALATLVESPSHTFSTGKRNGQPFLHTPDRLLDAQLFCHQEAMRFLGETGGRAKWTPNPKSKWQG